MLDVHPPHHAASTWRDFFIHIATIVIGLLIALSLEQAVELLHHRRLAREGREQLNRERDLDARSNEMNIFTTERHESDLKHDLAILHALKTRQPLPSQRFILRRFRYVYPEDTWLRLHQNGTVAYMDEREMTAAAYRYFNQDSFASRVTESMEALAHSTSMLRGENDPVQISLEESVTDQHFLDALLATHFTMPEAAIEDGYASQVEHADLTQLTPAQIDELERAIKLALADDDAELYYCFNIKRNLKNNPVP